jgi:hypothetical protein
MFDMFGIVNFRIKEHEIGMNETLNGESFIHYSKGLPPAFHKMMYQFDRSLSFAKKIDPFNGITELNPTTATDHIQQVVASYKRNKK